MRVVRVRERCLGCGATREVDLSPRWPTVPCPGLRPCDGEGRNRMGVCPVCAPRITEPVHTVGDFDSQLGGVSYLSVTSKVRLGPDEPFVPALWRSSRAMWLKVSQV